MTGTRLSSIGCMSDLGVLLDAGDEIRLGRMIEAGVLATHLLANPAEAGGGLEELRAVERAGREAWQCFLLANVRLVQSLAVQEAKRCDVGLDELFQEGFLGLAEALLRWDFAAGYRFSTYATQWIRRRVVNASVDHGVPGSARTALRARRVRGLADELTAELQRTATDAELAGLLGRSPAWVARMRVLQPFSTLEPDLLADPTAAPLDHEVDVHALLGSLPLIEAQVVRVRFGLEGAEPLRQRAAADALGLSLSTLRRHEGRALRRLRGWLNQEAA